MVTAFQLLLLLCVLVLLVFSVNYAALVLALMVVAIEIAKLRMAVVNGRRRK